MTFFRYGLLFIPYVLAVLLADSPTASYSAAWGGSFWVFYLTLTGKVKPLPGGRSLTRQLFRPIGLTQLVFAGFTAVSSVFYFLDINGYYYLSHDPLHVASLDELQLAAEAQRYYILAHASFSAGVLVFMDYRYSGEWKLRSDIDFLRFLLYFAVAMPFALPVLSRVPGIGQFLGKLGMLGFVAATLVFAVSIVQKRSGLIIASGALFGYHVVQALVGGWKEEILVSFLLLAAFLYPAYKRTVIALAPIGLAALLVILPMYVTIIRDLSWRGGVEADQAAQIALDRTLEGDERLTAAGWGFLRGRLSEINMFVKYMEYVPGQRPYYGVELVENGLIGIVPRAFWSGKPNMEQLSMQRVYDAGVVEEHSNVSAKPKFVVDAYLSAGALGVFIGFLLYGMLASWASRLAERWFGGYVVGSGVVYTALFEGFWVSNSFEFFFSMTFWSFVLMGMLFIAGRMTGFLVRQPRYQRQPA